MKYTRPYLLDLATFEITKLYKENAQVEHITLSPDGTRILLVIYQSPELDSAFIPGFDLRLFRFLELQTPSHLSSANFQAPCYWISQYG